MIQDSQNLQNQSAQPIYINQIVQKSNGIGTAGFVFSIAALFLGWIPVIGWMIWLLGAIFSTIGIFKSPRGLSIAGLIISFIGFILMIAVFGVILGSAALL